MSQLRCRARPMSLPSWIRQAGQVSASYGARRVPASAVAGQFLKTNEPDTGTVNSLLPGILSVTFTPETVFPSS